MIHDTTRIKNQSDSGLFFKKKKGGQSNANEDAKTSCNYDQTSSGGNLPTDKGKHFGRQKIGVICIFPDPHTARTNQGSCLNAGFRIFMKCLKTLGLVK